MSREALRRSSGVCALVASLALVSPPAQPQDLRIATTGCAKPVHLIAKGVPLSTVLRSLSASLHFDVAYHSETDPLVSIDAKLPAPYLVRDLARNMNFSMEEATDARCAQGRRIAKLSVLPDPAGGNRGAVASARPAWQTAEMERIGRLGMQDYLQSHGITEQPVAALAVH